jgi:hypothetical protein
MVNGAKYMENMFIMNVSNIEAETKDSGAHSSDRSANLGI